MDAELLATLRELDTASLADADKSIRVMSAAMRPFNPGRKLVGVARTVRCHEDFLAVIQALAEAQPGEVLVIDTQGSRRAVVGELFSLEAARHGLAGIVVDGLVRDTRFIRETSLPVYALGTCPVSGTTQQPGPTQLAIACAGVTVEPGDILVGDDDGIVVASAAHFRAIVPAARDIAAREAQLRERMAAGTALPAMTNLDAHLAALARGEDSRLAFRLDA